MEFRTPRSSECLEAQRSRNQDTLPGHRKCTEDVKEAQSLVWGTQSHNLDEFSRGSGRQRAETGKGGPKGVKRGKMAAF